MSARRSRLSLNTATTNEWTLEQAIQGCLRAGIPAIAPWRNRIAEAGVDRAAQLLQSAGLHVSSLCRGGFLTAATRTGRDAALEANRRAVEEAATLQADALVLIVGGLPDGSRDLAAAREMVADGLAQLVPFAQEAGVRLALEPLHPMYCADRSVLSTLAQALDLAERFTPEQMGVVLDTFHVWWDPDVLGEIERAGRSERIACLQVCDLMVPMPADPLLARAHVGDGPIDSRALAGAVCASGYDGYVEVEIFNADVWATPGEETLVTMIERYETHLSEVLEPGGRDARGWR